MGDTEDILPVYFATSMDDEWFRECIQRLCQSERGSREWNKALKGLIPKISKLPGLKRNNNPQYAEDYAEVFNNVMERVVKEICQDFQPQSNKSMAASLQAWINEKMRLRYEVLDIYRSSNQSNSTLTNPKGAKSNQKNLKKEFYEQAKKPPFSLNRILNQNGDETFEDYLADPTLNGLDSIIEKDQEKLEEQELRISVNLARYIEQDPQGKLRSCYPPRGNYVDCNCQLLAQRLLLKEPAESITKIANEIGVPYQSLISHWKRKCIPLLQSIGIEIYRQERLKEYVDEDAEGILQNCFEEFPACNAQFLAKRLLAIFQNPPAKFEEIAQELNAQGVNINAEIIQSHWEYKCLPLLSKIAIEQKYQISE